MTDRKDKAPSGLWRTEEGTPEGKYLVQRRDGSVVEWPNFVIGAKDPGMVKPKSPKPAKSEVEAYGFIRENLREVGWIVKDPARSGGGQVWTQNQCLNHPEIKRALHLSRPENVVKVGEDRLWIIESKADRKDIAKALREAIEDYAELINGIGGACQAILAAAKQAQIIQ